MYNQRQAQLFRLGRDIIISRDIAMLFIKKYLKYKGHCENNFDFIWRCYEVWLNEQYKENVYGHISMQEFRELVLFKFDNCVNENGKYNIEINIQQN